MRTVSRSLFVCLILLLAANIIWGQQIKMEGFLRVQENVDRNTQKTLDRQYYVEIFADKAYKLGTVPVATLLQDDEPLSQSVVVIPNDRIRFRINLPLQADPTKTYRVYVSVYEDEASRRYGKLVSIKTDAERGISADGNSRMKVGLRYDGGGGPGSEAQESLRYRRERISRIYKWAQKLTQPSELSQIILKTERLTAFGTQAHTVQQLQLDVASEQVAVDGLKIELGLELNGILPVEKYDAILAFNMSDAPFEIAIPVPQPGMPGIPSQSAPKANTDDQQVGSRPIERNLDIGLAFTSGLEKVVKDGKMILERRNRGTLDLRLAPFKDLITTKITKFPNALLNPGDKPDSTHARVNLFTPFYVDAKVSTGKIDDNSLALNRIVFGLQNEMRFYRSIGVNNTTYYGITFRGAHASDRDFKQLEAKGAIEFSPVWAFLNHRLIDQNEVEARILFPSEKPPLKLIPAPGKAGYEIRPLVGFEMGKTYHRDRPAPAIKPSDTVRRLYVGMNIVLNPFRYLTLTASDTYYFRFESKTDRYHNYFKGSIEFPLTVAVDFDRPAQTLFLQYENGGQPPFVTPDVKALKLGYRLQWDRWFWSLR